MKVKDIMEYNVVSIPSNTSIAEAKRIMMAHNISHLPVIDKGKLVGMVSERSIEQVSPSKATSLSVWELSYLLEKTQVKEVMRKDVVTVPPEADAEKVVALAQKNKIGSIVVVEKDKVVGIVTTLDFFYKIINPLLGIDVPGTRLEFADVLNPPTGTPTLENLISIVHKNGYYITTLHIEDPEQGKQSRTVCIHVSSDDVKKLMDAFNAQGYKPIIRER